VSEEGRRTKNPSGRDDVAKEIVAGDIVTRHDRMKNETVWSTLHQERTLVDRIAQQRLTWFGHVSRMGSEQLPVKVMHRSIIGQEIKEDNQRNG